MLAAEVRDESLAWENERQNRLLQRAQEERRAIADDVRRRLQLVDPVKGAAAPPWQDKLQAIPSLRSALMPLDESTPEDAWSKPFSLVKADFEPWLSFYAGYRSSRLFLGGAKPTQTPPILDFSIRALLDLKKVDPRFILEPPVQIDGPVEYFDAERAPHTERGPILAQSLERAADAMHRSQLRRAVERGRAMGNELHEALLGDGLVNLVRAWEKVYQRKPNVQELHLMLTNGRTTPVVVSPTAADRDSRSNSVPSAATPRRASGLGASPVPEANRVTEQSFVRPPASAAVQPVPPSQQFLTSPSGDEEADSAAPAPSNLRPLFWYFAHAVGLTCAGALAYLMLA